MFLTCQILQPMGRIGFAVFTLIRSKEIMKQIALSILELIFRRYNQDSFYYENEKFYSPPPGAVEAGGWDLGHGEDANHAIPVHLFPKHVTDLHMNQVCTSCVCNEYLRLNFLEKTYHFVNHFVIII